MVLGLFKRRNDRIPYALYGQIVEHARDPIFYADFGIEDTIDGRFNTISLHASLLFRRMRDMPENGRALMQEVFDIFMNDMDRSLREMGVGDTSVPKKMKRIAEVFYGAAKAYDAAFEAGNDGVLAEAIARNVFADEEGVPPGAESMARYVFASEMLLAEQTDAIFERGEIPFPDPARFRPS